MNISYKCTGTKKRTIQIKHITSIVLLQGLEILSIRIFLCMQLYIYREQLRIQQFYSEVEKSDTIRLSEITDSSTICSWYHTMRSICSWPTICDNIYSTSSDFHMMKKLKSKNKSRLI